MLVELTEKDKVLAAMKKTCLTSNYSVFKRCAPGMGQFFKITSVVNRVVLVDNRIAVQTT